MQRAPIAPAERQNESAGGVGRPPLQAFDASDIWPWIANWLKATFQTDIESLVVP
jgi:hypothetical protein